MGTLQVFQNLRFHFAEMPCELSLGISDLLKVRWLVSTICCTFWNFSLKDQMSNILMAGKPNRTTLWQLTKNKLTDE